MTDPASQPWFHGRITRQEAEDLLQNIGKRDGTYLLRESTAQNGSYALSICHNHKIIHYHIQRHTDGKVGIEDGPRFVGPVELVHHHMRRLDGLLVKLTIPCNRPEGIPPRTISGINQEQVTLAATAALRSMHFESTDETTAVQLKAKIESAIGSMMHAKQCWFHGLISREESERRLHACGTLEGMYLVRERQNPSGSFALGLCHDRTVVHYLFDSDPQGRLSIKSGPKFDNLMLAIDHYSQREDGLLCLLKDPCNVDLFEEKRRTLGRMSHSLDFSDFSTIQPPGRPSSKSFTTGMPEPLVSVPVLPPKGQRSLPPPLPNRNSMEIPSIMSTSPRGAMAPAPPCSPRPMVNGAAGGDGVTSFESIYDSAKIRKTVGYHSHFKGIENRAFELNANNLTLQEELGHGQFGSVLKGQYIMSNGNTIPVAVKRLKSDEINNPKSEIMHEAKIMMRLDHPHIVRIIGMCQANTMMLVMELAGAGPMNKYLKRNKDMEMTKILILMLQVAEGMAYLDSMQFVHRDLAARNVLVVNEDFVKISDFGMSRAMGAGSDYYKAGKPGKWPLKWYAPECIYYRKFSSKSDVWSYGVTLWEATSYGAKPYHGLNGQVILEKIENNYRLPSPQGITPETYKLMKSCWEFNSEDRPTFREIGGTLYRIINHLKMG